MQKLLKALQNAFLTGRKQQKHHTEGIYDEGDVIKIFIQCDRCGEVIPVRLAKSSEIERVYEDAPSGAFYHVRKLVSGSSRCFNRIEVEIYFDKHYRPVATDVNEGKLVERVES